MRLGALTRFLLVGLAHSASAVAQVPTSAADVMIFFDWGKTTVDRDYIAALDAALAAANRGSAQRVLVEGHSDRSGNSGANRRASLVRANAVRDLLVARGVAADDISVIAAGEDSPFIPTADGVREPQNRRVDVRFVPGSEAH